MTDFFDELAAPFPPESISWRIGSTTQDKNKGMALAYLDSRDVQERLDAVCGPAGWQDEYPHAGAKTVCRIGIKIGGEWIWKSDGAGDTDVEAEKGALSDAFKRAAVKWGIGRYLYNTASPWVEIEPAGRSFKIKADQYAILEKAAQAAAVALEWGNPEDRATVKALAQTIRTCVLTADGVRLYREQNAGVIEQLRVKAKAHIFKLLDDISASDLAKAA